MATIPGTNGTVITFNVTGSALTNFANDFSNALSQGLTPNDISATGSVSTDPGALNEFFGNTSVTSFTLSTADQFTYISSGTPVTVDVTAIGQTLAAQGSGTTINDSSAGGNNFLFIDGNNTYNGLSSVGDTVSGGTGYDTINTGTGSTTVYSGTGDTLINLNDTVGGDIVDLQNGNSTVNADGVADTVFASSTGTIFGGSAGPLTFASADSMTTLAVTIVGGSGGAMMSGASGLDLVFANSTAATNVFNAGAGNETLNGANAAGGFAFFGDTNTADASSINDTVVGGAGNDYFATGGGMENFVAGSGAAIFEINTVSGGAMITIQDFSANDSVSFAGSITGSTVADGNITYTLSDGTTVDFIGITSIPTGHII